MASSRSTHLQTPELKPILYLAVRVEPAAAEVIYLFQMLGSFSEERDSIPRTYIVVLTACIPVPYSAAPSSGPGRYCAHKVSMQSHMYRQNDPRLHEL